VPSDDSDKFAEVHRQDVAEKEVDVVITTGDVTVRRYDFLKEVLSSAGLEPRFQGVGARPGHPLLFWNHAQKRTTCQDTVRGLGLSKLGYESMER
jgi:molybdopterin biosynthesis enzyme